MADVDKYNISVKFPEQRKLKKYFPLGFCHNNLHGYVETSAPLYCFNNEMKIPTLFLYVFTLFGVFF